MPAAAGETTRAAKARPAAALRSRRTPSSPGHPAASSRRRSRLPRRPALTPPRVSSTDAEEEPGFPVGAVTAPPQAERHAFGPEIALEEERADADTRAAAEEHTAGDTSIDMLDLWVLSDPGPAVRT